jgi:hypothetical protein
MSSRWQYNSGLLLAARLRNSSKHSLCNVKTKKGNKDRRRGRRKKMEEKKFLTEWQ